MKTPLRLFASCTLLAASGAIGAQELATPTHPADSSKPLQVQFAFPEDSLLAGHSLEMVTRYDSFSADDAGRVAAQPKGALARSQELRLNSPRKRRLRYSLGLLVSHQWPAPRALPLPGTSLYRFNSVRQWELERAWFGQVAFGPLSLSSVLADQRGERRVSAFDWSTQGEAPGLSPQQASRPDAAGRLGMERRLRGDLLAYVLLSSGQLGLPHAPGSGFSDSNSRFDNLPANSARNVELGARTSLLGQRLSVNAALFQSDVRGYRQTGGFIDADGLFRARLQDVGEMQARGLEVDSRLRLSKQAQLQARVAYVDAVLADAGHGACDALDSPRGVVCDASVRGAGQALPNAPRLKAELQGRSTLDLDAPGVDAFVAGVYRWQSAMALQFNGQPLAPAAAGGVLNVQAGIEDKRARFRLSMFLQNALDHGGPNWLPERETARQVGARFEAKL